MGLEPGLRGNSAFTVRQEHLAPALGSGEACVLATPILVAGVEQAACNALAGLLPAGMSSVGIHVDIRHLAATPAGVNVRFEALLSAISENGKCLYFDVSAFDESGEIGDGKHERVIVEVAKFEAKAEARKAADSPGSGLHR